MKALIVAAGFGSRLRAVSPSKPLTPVGGVPLIEHVIGAARAGGATSFVVVTGYAGDAVEAFLSGLSARTGLPIACVRTGDWSLSNGHSVLTGAGLTGPDRHLLLMADHMFDPRIAATVIAATPAALTLGIDRRLDNPLVDMDDVTRVRMNSTGVILDIGKHLAHYDAFDCGVFAVDGRFHDALRQSIDAGGAGSISAGVMALSHTGQAHGVDIGDAWWLDVDDARALGQAEQALAA